MHGFFVIIVQSLDRQPLTGKAYPYRHDEYQISEGDHHIVGVQEGVLLPVHIEHLAYSSHVHRASRKAGGVHSGNLGAVGNVRTKDGISGYDSDYDCQQSGDHRNQLVSCFTLAEGETEKHQRDGKRNHRIRKQILHLQSGFSLGQDADIGDDGSEEIEHKDRAYLAYPSHLPAQPKHSCGNDAVSGDKDDGSNDVHVKNHIFLSNAWRFPQGLRAGSNQSS